MGNQFFPHNSWIIFNEMIRQQTSNIQKKSHFLNWSIIFDITSYGFNVSSQYQNTMFNVTISEIWKNKLECVIVLWKKQIQVYTIMGFVLAINLLQFSISITIYLHILLFVSWHHIESQSRTFTLERKV